MPVTGGLLELMGKRDVRIEGWEVFAFECLNDGIVEIEGKVPTVDLFGERSWSGSEETLRVLRYTNAQIAAFEQEYKAQGNCPECLNEGRVLQSWSATNGITWKPCKCQAA